LFSRAIVPTFFVTWWVTRPPTCGAVPVQYPEREEAVLAVAHPNWRKDQRGRSNSARASDCRHQPGEAEEGFPLMNQVGPYIYFVQARGNGPIKIGTTQNNPRHRMVKLQTDCPWPVKLLGAIKGTVAQEKRLQLLLSHFRTKGEWFEPHPVVVAAVNEALRIGKRAEFVRQPKPVKPRQPRYNHPLCMWLASNCVRANEFAQRIGVSKSYLSMLLSGARPFCRIPGHLALKINEETGIPIDQLMKPISKLGAPLPEAAA
jgi:hypothetical protein